MAKTRDTIKKKLMDFVPIGKENALSANEFEKKVGWFPKEYFSSLLGMLYREKKISRISYTNKFATGFAYYIPNEEEKKKQKIEAIFAKSGHQLTLEALDFLRDKISTINVGELIEKINTGTRPTFVITKYDIQKCLQKVESKRPLIRSGALHLTGLTRLDKALDIFERAEHLYTLIEDLDNSKIQRDSRDIDMLGRFKAALLGVIRTERNELIRTVLNPRIIHYLDGKENEQ